MTRSLNVISSYHCVQNLKNRLTEPTSEGIRETRPQWREQQHEELKRVGRRKKAGGNRGGDDER